MRLPSLLRRHRIHFNRNSAPADRQGLPRCHPRSSARSAPARPLGSDIGMAFSFGATPGASVSALLPDSPLRLLESALPGAPGGSGERASHHMTLSHRSASPAAPCGHSTTAAACGCRRLLKSRRPPCSLLRLKCRLLASASVARLRLGPPPRRRCPKRRPRRCLVPPPHPHSAPRPRQVRAQSCLTGRPEKA